MRNLILVLGDQLSRRSPVFDDYDADQDSIWMAEAEEEATHVWCHKLRIACFFSAMRHFRDELRERGSTVHYHTLSRNPSEDRGRSFREILERDLQRFSPEKLVVCQPGDYRVLQSLRETAESSGLELVVHEDRHFYCTIEEFRNYASNRERLLLENFYRHLRRKHGILLNDDGEPAGGRWNFDDENRQSFGRQGPQDLPRHRQFRPDDVTREVLELVESRFSSHPGSLEHFQLPVTRREARAQLRHFIRHILPRFGPHEDAMWTDEPFLFHSRLSAALNLKLLDPRDCIEAAVAAWQAGAAPIASVEGFVRQILGWREFIRGVYWLNMPGYADLNHLDHQAELPSFYWDGQTEMRCVQQSMQHVLHHAYSHHIHRLMVLGNLALLLGVHPHRFHEWHMAMYVDAIDWVSLPNTLGMSQFGDGGLFATKPYCAGGNYISRMSNFCSDCTYNPKHRTGEEACPLTTLYWNFLDRHAEQFADNPRMSLPLKNLERLRKNHEEIESIRQRSMQLQQQWSE